MTALLPLVCAIGVASHANDMAQSCTRPAWGSHFRHAKLKCPMPPGLEATYNWFVAAARAGDRRALERVMLPGSIQFARRPRPDNEDRQYGHDIDLGFMRRGFSPQVLHLSKYETTENCYSVRTFTTGIGFVQTKTGAWKAYNYSDFPIE